MFRMLAPILLLSVSSRAGLTTYWGLQDTAKAPVLVVGRVLSVEKGARDADVSFRQRRDVFDMTAQIEVLRSFTQGGGTIAANPIRVRFLWFPPTGIDLPLPGFEAGQVVIVPLQENRNPATEVWRMTAESGEGLILPAAAELRDGGPPPATARLFLLREIANSLGRGTPSEAVRTGRYLATQDMTRGDQGIAGDLMVFLEPMLGSDRQGWANLLTNMLAGRGVPRPTVAQLFSNNIHPPQESWLWRGRRWGNWGKRRRPMRY